MSGERADLEQQAAEDAVATAELEACVDLDDAERPPLADLAERWGIDSDAGDAPLEQLRREPDDDQPAWRQPCR